MTASQQLPAFDFSKPGGLGNHKHDRLTQWFNQFCLSFTELWSKETSISLVKKFSSCDFYSFDYVKRQFPKPAVANFLYLGESRVPGILVMNQQLALSMTCQLLGETLDELPAERQLTSVEESLLNEFLKLLIGCLSESWPEKEPMVCELGEMELEPHRNRFLGPREVVLVCTTNVTVAETELSFSWVFPNREFEMLLGDAEDKEVVPAETPRDQMLEQAARIPVDLTMQLGHCKISLSALSKLQAGDILVLEQSINEPLPITIANQVKFTGWLGRNKNKRAYKIQNVTWDETA